MTVVENLEMDAYTVADTARTRRTMEQIFAIVPHLAQRWRQAVGTMSDSEQ